MLRAAIDFERNPCEDFYLFACGRFLNGNSPFQIARHITVTNNKIQGT